MHSLNHFSNKCPIFSLCAGPYKLCSRSCLRVKDSLKGKRLSQHLRGAHSILCKCSASICSKLRAVPPSSLYHWQLTFIILVWPVVEDKSLISISNVTENWKRTDIWTVSALNVIEKFGGDGDGSDKKPQKKILLPKDRWDLGRLI